MIIKKIQKFLNGEINSEEENITVESIENEIYSINSDEPLIKINDDSFSRGPFANGISKLIIERKESESFVIGIYGEWGTGKTTLLNFIKENLEGNSTVVIVNFNPWKFEDENQLILIFFQTLADALKKELHTKKEKIGQILTQYSTILAPLSLTFGLGLGSITTAGGAQALGVTLSSVKLDELKTRLDLILKNENKKIVIFIDDIDRLENSEIRSLFKLIKISANFQNIFYIVAFDENNVAKALGQTYSGGDPESGMLFLEKIIQLPLHLPKITNEDLTNFALLEIYRSCSSAGITLEEKEFHTFYHYFSNGLQNKLRTPRLLKRYANALKFSLPLVKEEVNYVDFMLIEGIRIVYPNLYETIRSNREDFLLYSLSGPIPDSQRIDAMRNGILQLIKNSLAKDNEKDSSSVLALILHLFPRSSILTGPGTYYQHEWDVTWERQKRICSEKYFNRYFIYTIPKGDLSDIKFNQFLSDINELPVNELTQKFDEEFDRDETTVVIHKIQFNLEKIPTINCGKLALVLASNGSKYKQTGSGLISLTPSGMAAITIYQLLERIPEPSERGKVAKEIVKNANPINFLAVIFRELNIGNKNKETLLFSEKQEEELISDFKDRIRRNSKNENFYVEYPRQAIFLFFFWGYGGYEKEVKKYISYTLASNPENVVKLLLTFSIQRWEFDTGLPIREKLSIKSYQRLKEYVDPEVVVIAIKQILGDVNPEEYDDEKEDISHDKQLMFQFLSLHEKDLKKILNNDEDLAT